jgi:hypothetical protein
MSTPVDVLFILENLAWSSATTSMGQELQAAGSHLGLDVQIRVISEWPNCDKAQTEDADLVILCLGLEAALLAMTSNGNHLEQPFTVLLPKRVILENLPKRIDWSIFLVGIRRIPVHDIEALGMLSEFIIWQQMDHE